MKKCLAIILSVCMTITLTACNGVQSGQSSINSSVAESKPQHTETPSSERSNESSSEQSKSESDNSAPVQANDTDSNILIAYFTWADNTKVDDPSAIDVDASTSASVLVPGNAAKIASWIEKRTGGDLFSIIVDEPYSSDYDECLDRAADEKAANARPTLKTRVEDMEQYDTVFLGFPNWWYTVPMAIHSFLEEYDFSGKTIVPFVTHGTGGLASTIQDIKADLPNSEVLEPIGVYRPEVDSSRPAVEAWLDSLGYTDDKSANSETENNERKLKMTVDGQEIAITLYDTPAANSLYEMLPLDLDFEDFNSVEKIAYLDSPLITEGEPDSFDPDVGDLCYYVPWGNLSIFYKDFRNSNSLVSLGRIDSGMEIILGMTGDFTVTLERAE